jgi:hypothetical protein
MPDTERIELDLDWGAELVEPGTPSDEDPTEEIPPGWWVFGYNQDGVREAEMYVRGIYDVHGDDVSQRVAELLADRLNEMSDQ